MNKGFSKRDWPEPKPQKDKAGYTKGEWRVERFVGNTPIGIRCEDGRLITVVSQGVYGEAIANAQLIASAPDLYEALKELIRRDEYGSIRLPTQAADIMRKALTKAEGKDENKKAKEQDKP